MPALAFHSQLSNDSFYEKLRKIQYCFKESSSKENHDDNDADVWYLDSFKTWNSERI